jgi:hypothetical protein
MVEKGEIETEKYTYHVLEIHILGTTKHTKAESIVVENLDAKQ